MATEYSVYVLRSTKDNKLYIGMSDDVERRLVKHNQGKVISTKHRRPLVLIYTEMFATKSQAAKRERFLKSGPGHKFLKSVFGQDDISSLTQTHPDKSG
ncbi:MAG: GIY-YIG nuclease family protein [Bacteroidetes bacterium]|nr:GIY-YIG nuclease family protein [Bacteroidota bacterium]